MLLAVCITATTITTQAITQVQPEPTPTHSVRPTLKSVNGTIAPTKAQTTSSASHLGISYVLYAALLIRYAVTASPTLGDLQRKQFELYYNLTVLCRN